MENRGQVTADGADVSTSIEVLASKLMGRGGAAFPTGRKWDAVAKAPARPHYVVCNADESEPGTFKDRVLMEGDPFAVIEGMTIAGLATGSERGYLYVRGEYPVATRRMGMAVAMARAAGLLGSNVMNAGFAFEGRGELQIGAFGAGQLYVKRRHRKRGTTNLGHVFGGITTARFQTGGIRCLFEDFGQEDFARIAKLNRHTIREIIKRDLGVKIEGVVKVFDRTALASEFKEYVVTDKIEEELKKIFDTFTQVSDTLRRGGRPLDRHR